MKTYEQILKDSEENPEILGLILTGSRGKGFDSPDSDYDLILITSDSSKADIERKFEDTDNVDKKILTLEEFKSYASWDSDFMWDRYDYAHTKILVDKIGNLEELVQIKGYIPKAKQKEFIEYWIDGYVNGVFRSIKSIKKENLFGAHLEASNSMLDLLTLVFGLDGRHRPFLGYTKNELEKYPLENIPWSTEEFIEKVEKVLTTADIKIQQELLIGIEKKCRELGYGHVFDNWEGKDRWTMEYSPE